MISPEFIAAVDNKNLLLTRIMLKDSMVVDPTMEQFTERFDYAKRKLPDLMMKYDGEELESDCSKWTVQIMNIELVELINNFSQERLQHLQEIIRVLYASEIKTITAKRKATPHIGIMSRQSAEKSGIRDRSNLEAPKKLIYKYGKDIGVIMQHIDSPDRISPSDIIKLEEKVNSLRTHIQKYKKNKGMR